MAAIRSQVLYIAKFVASQLGIGSYLPADVSANTASFRVMRPELFDPNGGSCFELDSDKLITYTGMNGDLLTGASGNTGDLKSYTNTASDIVMVSGVLDAEELEHAIDKHRTWVEQEMFDDVEHKRWKSNLGWFDTDVAIRDSDTASYNAVTLGGSDTIDYERGEVRFATARTESRLFLCGDRYNPFCAIADIITMHAADDRFLRYLQVGQTAKAKMTADQLAAYWRGRGWAYSL